MLAVGNTKACSSCKEVLPLAAFCKHRSTQDKLQNVCKKCKAFMTKNWKYGLKSGYYDLTVKTQNSCCAICTLPTSKLVIDHCHQTNKLRALLCRKCNSMLGMCNDNIETLQNAILYLIKFRDE